MYTHFAYRSPTIRLKREAGRMRARATTALYPAPIVETGGTDLRIACRAMYAPAFAGSIPVCSSCSIFATEREMRPP